MIKDFISVISIYSVLICSSFLIVRKIVSFFIVPNKVLANKFYAIDIVCLLACMLFVFCTLDRKSVV